MKWNYISTFTSALVGNIHSLHFVTTPVYLQLGVFTFWFNLSKMWFFFLTRTISSLIKPGHLRWWVVNKGYAILFLVQISISSSFILHLFVNNQKGITHWKQYFSLKLAVPLVLKWLYYQSGMLKKKAVGGGDYGQNGQERNWFLPHVYSAMENAKESPSEGFPFS